VIVIMEIYTCKPDQQSFEFKENLRKLILYCPTFISMQTEIEIDLFCRSL